MAYQTFCNRIFHIAILITQVLNRDRGWEVLESLLDGIRDRKTVDGMFPGCLCCLSACARNTATPNAHPNSKSNIQSLDD